MAPIEVTYNVMEAARRQGVSRVFTTSTSEAYGTALYTPIDEQHPLQPQSPYSANKIGADQLALSYQMSFGLSVVVARPFNTHGPRQSARAISPSLATQLLSKRAHIDVGSLDPVRDFRGSRGRVSTVRHGTAHAQATLTVRRNSTVAARFGAAGKAPLYPGCIDEPHG